MSRTYKRRHVSLTEADNWVNGWVYEWNRDFKHLRNPKEYYRESYWGRRSNNYAKKMAVRKRRNLQKRELETGRERDIYHQNMDKLSSWYFW